MGTLGITPSLAKTGLSLYVQVVMQQVYSVHLGRTGLRGRLTFVNLIAVSVMRTLSVPCDEYTKGS